MYWFELLQNYAEAVVNILIKMIAGSLHHNSENENFLPDDKVVTIVCLVVVAALPPTARVVSLAHSTRV